MVDLDPLKPSNPIAPVRPVDRKDKPAPRRKPAPRPDEPSSDGDRDKPELDEYA
jgi:hypothetical protein